MNYFLFIHKFATAPFIYYEIPNKFLNFCYPKIALDLKIALKNFLIFVKEENRLNNNLEKVLNLLKNENI